MLSRTRLMWSLCVAVLATHTHRAMVQAVPLVLRNKNQMKYDFGGKPLTQMRTKNSNFKDFYYEGDDPESCSELFLVFKKPNQGGAGGPTKDPNDEAAKEVKTIHEINKAFCENTEHPITGDSYCPVVKAELVDLTGGETPVKAIKEPNLLKGPPTQRTTKFVDPWKECGTPIDCPLSVGKIVKLFSGVPVEEETEARKTKSKELHDFSTLPAEAYPKLHNLLNGLARLFFTQPKMIVDFQGFIDTSDGKFTLVDPLAFDDYDPIAKDVNVVIWQGLQEQVGHLLQLFMEMSPPNNPDRLHD